jgi:hypothetical protein
MRGATRITDFAYRISQWTDRKVEAYRYDDIHQRQADAYYEVICAQHPERRPDEGVLRRIDAYAREVLGSETYAPWLRVYTAWAGEFKEGWIPDNYFGRVVMPAIQGPARHLSTFKTLSRRLTGAGELLPDLVYRVRGQWVDTEGRALRPSEVEEIAYRHGPRVVVKADDSNQGKGVRLVERGRDDLLELDGDFVVQRMISQPDWMARFNADNLATIRITTVKPPGGRASWQGGNLRFGLSGSAILKSARAIRIPMLDAEGTLGDYGALPDWTRVTKHPESGLEWAGLELPGFEAARDACARLHDGIPHVTFIGWDVALERGGGFAILEWNTVHPGIVFIEANTGPQFAEFGWDELWKR